MKKRFTSGNYFQVSNYIFQFGLRPSSFVLYCYLKMRDNPERGLLPDQGNDLEGYRAKPDYG